MGYLLGNVVQWVDDVRASVQAELDGVGLLLSSWDAALRAFGGDPIREDWKAFRPLRLAREEDFSDWLAFLLRLPEGHAIARRIFAAARPSNATEDVRREERVLFARRRADLVLLCAGNRACHVEVKVWDDNFDKTLETGNGCRLLFNTRGDWRDYVLLPDENVSQSADAAAGDNIGIVTWGDVTRETRHALLRPGNSLQWVAFARVFCGAVEEKILRVPRIPFEGARSNSAAVFRFGRILREALDAGD